MAAQTLTLAGKRFVILPEKEYRALRNGTKPPRKMAQRPHRMTKQDWGDVAEAKRVLKRIEDGTETLVPFGQVRAEPGLK